MFFFGLNILKTSGPALYYFKKTSVVVHFTCRRLILHFPAPASRRSAWANCSPIYANLVVFFQRQLVKLFFLKCSSLHIWFLEQGSSNRNSVLEKITFTYLIIFNSLIRNSCSRRIRCIVLVIQLKDGPGLLKGRGPQFVFKTMKFGIVIFFNLAPTGKK